MNNDAVYNQLRERLPETWQRLLQDRLPQLLETPADTLASFSAGVQQQYQNMQSALQSFNAAYAILAANKSNSVRQRQDELDARLQELMKQRSQLQMNPPEKPESFLKTFFVGYLLGTATLLITLYCLLAALFSFFSPEEKWHDVQYWGPFVICFFIIGFISLYCIILVITDIDARKKIRQHKRAIQDCDDAMRELAGGASR